MSWVTWEPKSTIRILSCMDGDVSRTCPESGCAKAVRGGFLRALRSRVKPVVVSSNAILAPDVLRKCSPSGLFTAGSVEAAMAFETQRMRLPVAASGRAARRAALFRESLAGLAERWALGLAWALGPTQSAACRTCCGLCFDEFLAPDYALPDPESARSISRPDLPASCTISRCRRSRRLSARALPLRAYCAAEMVVAAATLGPVLQ